VRVALDALRRSAENGTNTMPAILDCVRAYVTLGEMMNALREVFGTYQEKTLI
jgi:methylmalonyl-CoA mutase N-terminal domain/subunit